MRVILDKHLMDGLVNKLDFDLLISFVLSLIIFMDYNSIRHIFKDIPLFYQEPLDLLFRHEFFLLCLGVKITQGRDKNGEEKHRKSVIT